MKSTEVAKLLINIVQALLNSDFQALDYRRTDPLEFFST